MHIDKKIHILWEIEYSIVYNCWKYKIIYDRIKIINNSITTVYQYIIFGNLIRKRKLGYEIHIVIVESFSSIFKTRANLIKSSTSIFLLSNILKLKIVFMRFTHKKIL